MDGEFRVRLLSALHLGRLPPFHRDPFDRMFARQAIVHGLVILGPDPLIARAQRPAEPARGSGLLGRVGVEWVYYVQ